VAVRRSWHWFAVALLIVAAATIARVLFWNGPLGSDDVVYLRRALDVANGEWRTANYNGALRYGFNIPAGMLLRALGTSDITVNLWPLFCSLAEIGVVYAFARDLWGTRAAAISALILAFVPLHIASATRIHADPVVALFVTLSFTLFCWAERRDSAWLFFWAGIAMGAVFWTKELAIVALVPLITYPLIWWRLRSRWLYVIAGGLVMLVAHMVLMYVISGDPLHLFKVVTGQVSRDFIGKGDGEDAAGFYFRYLFLDVKHTWIVAFLAVAGTALFVRARWQGIAAGRAETTATLARSSAYESYPLDRDGTSFVLFWCVGMLIVLSFMPVSLSPLRLVMKQSNYLTLFLAPLALLAGWFTASLSSRLGVAVIGLMVGGGFLLGALEQQAYRVVTSNSKAALALLDAYPQSKIYGTSNNSNIAAFQSMIQGVPSVEDRVDTYAASTNRRNTANAGGDRLVVLDRETWDWGRSQPIKHVPPCWSNRGDLVPTGFGWGRIVVRILDSVATSVPSRFGAPVHRALGAIANPLPATVYAVDSTIVDCEPPPGTSPALGNGPRP
jgi:4-amino-4-deoxy-L-arabinose transferase-like glycosyltransferase